MATATTAPGILQPTASSKLTVTGQAATPTSPAQAGPSTTSGSGNGNENGNGSGSGSSSSGDTTRTGSGSDSSNGTSKSGLSTGELIGIIIGGISAVATIVGVWVAVKRKKDRKGSVSTPSSGYYQQIGVQQVVLPTNNFPRPFPPVNPNMYQPPYPNAQPMPMHYPQGPPPKYEQRQK
ncbi:hypothetical protein B0H67DRAFT_642232 [Lasiosphaeris hirsuta]|uniref:Uncharacterized protein n=1 Tax=Lasiosphaeris hirsuta TaxID=260670 RepID=A0AA40E3M7_9PEZI|nr:hypothetical protein B0H67DRAFT_642232 [Lasiosphaeris hirsuta]